MKQQRMKEGKKYREVWIEMVIFAIGAIVTSWLYGQYMTWAGIFPLN